MSPLLHLLILTSLTASPSTHPATIDTANPFTERSTIPMAQGNTTPAGGGHPPQFHPPKSAHATDRIGQRAGGPINLNAKTIGHHNMANEGRNLTPVEHTGRPR